MRYVLELAMQRDDAGVTPPLPRRLGQGRPNRLAAAQTRPPRRLAKTAMRRNILWGLADGLSPGRGERKRLGPQKPAMRQQQPDEQRPGRIPPGELGLLVQGRVRRTLGEPRLNCRPDMLRRGTLSGAAHVLPQRAAAPPIQHAALAADCQHTGLKVAFRVAGPRSPAQMPGVLIGKDAQPAAVLAGVADLVVGGRRCKGSPVPKSHWPRWRGSAVRSSSRTLPRRRRGLRRAPRTSRSSATRSGKGGHHRPR